MKKEKSYSLKEINEIISQNGLDFNFEELLNQDSDIIWWKKLSYDWKIIMLYNHNYEYRLFSSGRIKDFNSVLEEIKHYNKFELKKFIDELKEIKDCFFNFDTSLLITDFKPLENFLRIERLFLNGMRCCNLETMPTLESVKFLDAKNSALNSLLNISKFKNLEHLDIHNTHISSLNGIEELKKLNFLNASDTDIDSLKGLENLKNLKYLSIFRTEIKNLDTIGKLENLRIIYAYSTNIRDLNKLAELKSLVKININNTSINDLLPLKENHNLQEVAAKGTNVTLENAEKLKALMPETIILL